MKISPVARELWPESCGVGDGVAEGGEAIGDANRERFAKKNLEERS